MRRMRATRTLCLAAPLLLLLAGAAGGVQLPLGDAALFMVGPDGPDEAGYNVAMGDST